MNIDTVKNIFAKPAVIQEMREQNAQLAKQTEILEGQVGKYREVQEALVKDILTLTEQQSAYVGNEYRTYSQAVKAIADKYNGGADWGVIQTGTIIDLRAAFILGEGIQVTHTTEARAEAESELQWAEDFLDYNDLDAEMAQEMAKEAEIEGKIAIRIFYDREKYRDWPGMVSARYIPWTSRNYTVTANKDDYSYYEKLSWEAGADYAAGNLGEDEFIYKKFGGRINDPNQAQPKIMKCLTQIDRLDKALRDLREINHLFASPTPDFKAEDETQASKLLDYLKNINWKIGKMIAHTGEFNYKSPDTAGIQNLISEIELCVKMISGTTGIPIHYLGLLDLLHNRATGENVRELIMAVTSKERMIWVGAYEELFTKAMKMFNAKAYGQKSTKLDPEKIKVDIPLISQDHWDHLKDVLIPAAMAGIVSKEAVAAEIPGIDMEAEAERKKEKEAKDAERAKQDMEYLKVQVAANAKFNQANEK